ncbi:CDPK-related kinase 5 [Capsicum chinense]|nr:CDPK-related kinase 5 [Capsicum chinense]
MLCGVCDYVCYAGDRFKDLEICSLAVKCTELGLTMTTAIAIEDVRREVKILRALTGHNHLVKFYDSYENHNNVYIVMDKLDAAVDDMEDLVKSTLDFSLRVLFWNWDRSSQVYGEATSDSCGLGELGNSKEEQIAQPVHFLDYMVYNSSHKAPLIVTVPRSDMLCAKIIKYYSLKRFVEETGKPLQEWAPAYDGANFCCSSGFRP